MKTQSPSITKSKKSSVSINFLVEEITLVCKKDQDQEYETRTELNVEKILAPIVESLSVRTKSLRVSKLDDSDMNNQKCIKDDH
ncbi:hypothetical protein SLA2020_378620 [Shorea laevis]